MNTRNLGEHDRFIPVKSRAPTGAEQITAEQIAFDKAEDAASVEKIRFAIEQVSSDLKALGEADPDGRKRLEVKKAHLVEQLRAAEEAIRAKEVADKDNGGT
jgi:hypothetical protein